MTNPIAPTSPYQIPPPTEPIVEPDTGLPTPNYYRYELSQFTRTGGTGGSDAATIEATANEALAAATSAATLADIANTHANTALSVATTGSGVANTANTNATSALSSVAAINATALFNYQNLVNLTDPAEARGNLGLAALPLIVTIDSANVTKYIPVPRNLSFPTNCLGSLVYCGVAPTATVTIQVAYIRSGLSTNLFTVTLFHGGNIGFFSAQPPVSVLTGDILTIRVPSDSTLAGIGMTLLPNLT